MPRYKCTIEYEGTAFCGWQRQTGSPSIQQYIEEAITRFSGEEVTVITAGRTDAGVHALGQVIHFDLTKEFLPYKVRDGINSYLYRSRIVLKEVSKVDDTFHARFSATERHYTYRMINRMGHLTLDYNRAWHIRKPLDVDKMQQAAKYLVGYHDFTSFRDAECQAESPLKTLNAIEVIRQGENIYIHVAARSFLHHMVRNIAGTLKWVGEGRVQPDAMQGILAARDRRCAGPTAPAGGLYLVRVEYKE